MVSLFASISPAVGLPALAVSISKGTSTFARRDAPRETAVSGREGGAPPPLQGMPRPAFLRSLRIDQAARRAYAQIPPDPQCPRAQTQCRLRARPGARENAAKICFPVRRSMSAIAQ